MAIPIQNLNKAELVKMAKGRCRHRHSYIQHPQCYWQERGVEPKVGAFDIEILWANFKADTSYLLTYAIKTIGTKELITATIKKSDLNVTDGREDKRLVKQLLEDLQSYDVIVGYFSKRFDVPFVRTRALIDGLEFPGYGSFKHIDVYDIVKSKFSMRPKSQDNACKQLVGVSHKTHPTPICWRNAGRGDEKAIQEILHHNVQ